MLIGLTGKARSGKDTVAKYLNENYEMVLYAWADPLKKACSEMFGVPLNFFYDDALKEEIIPEWGISPRVMAQKLGTEGGRELFFNDIWIRRGEVEYMKYQNSDFVITDCRFPNEANWIRSSGGYVIHIERDSIPDSVGVSNHASEAGVDIEESDFVINNNGTLDELHIRIKNLIENRLM